MSKKYMILKFSSKAFQRFFKENIQDDFFLISYSQIRRFPNEKEECYLTGVSILNSTNNFTENNGKGWKFKNSNDNIWSPIIRSKKTFENSTLKDITDEETAKLIFESGEYNV